MEDKFRAGQSLRWHTLGEHAPDSLSPTLVHVLMSSILLPGRLCDIDEMVRRMVVPTRHQVRICFGPGVELLPGPLTNLLSNVVNSPTASPTHLDGWLCLDVS